MTGTPERALFPNDRAAADRLAAALEPWLTEVLDDAPRAADLAPRIARYVVASDWRDEQVATGLLHGEWHAAREVLALALDADTDDPFLALLRDREAAARRAWDEHRRTVGGQVRLVTALEPYLTEVLADANRATGLAKRVADAVAASGWFTEQVVNGLRHGQHVGAYEVLALALDAGIDGPFLDLLRDRDRTARQAWDEHRRAIGGR